MEGFGCLFDRSVYGKYYNLGLNPLESVESRDRIGVPTLMF